MQTNRRFLRLAAPTFLFALLALSGCGLDVDIQLGDADAGPMTTVTRDVDTFTELAISSAFDVTVELGPEASVEVELGENLVDHLEVEQTGDRVSIDLGGRDVNSELRATITTPDLDLLDVAGASQVSLGVIGLDRLDLRLAGASHVVADGSIDELTVDASGASHVDFGRVSIATADVRAKGASHVDLAGADEVEGSLEGASHLTVHESTQVDVRTSGASSVDS